MKRLLNKKREFKHTLNHYLCDGLQKLCISRKLFRARFALYCTDRTITPPPPELVKEWFSGASLPNQKFAGLLQAFFQREQSGLVSTVVNGTKEQKL